MTPHRDIEIIDDCDTGDILTITGSSLCRFLDLDLDFFFNMTILITVVLTVKG